MIKNSISRQLQLSQLTSSLSIVYHYLDNLETIKNQDNPYDMKSCFIEDTLARRHKCTFSPFTSLKICYFILLGILKSLTTPFFAFVFKSSLTAPNPVRKRNHSLLPFFCLGCTPISSTKKF